MRLVFDIEKFADEALAVLGRIATGELKIPEAERLAAEQGYSGIEVFHVGGWVFAVFNDCDEWDYLQWVVHPDGTELDYEDMPERLQDYQPPVETARAIWGLEP